MSFRITGLDPAPFQTLFALDDAALARAGARRVKVESKPGAPCRISLEDAEIGETVLLLSYAHQDADTPYRQQGPIFVRESARAFDAVNELPPVFAGRTLSLRGFDAAHMMIEAELTEGAKAAELIERFFANAEVVYIHAHNAKRGCFAARIERA
jgi:hypothetical protein